VHYNVFRSIRTRVRPIRRNPYRTGTVDKGISLLIPKSNDMWHFTSTWSLNDYVRITRNFNRITYDHVRYRYLIHIRTHAYVYTRVDIIISWLYARPHVLRISTSARRVITTYRTSKNVAPEHERARIVVDDV